MNVVYVMMIYTCVFCCYAAENGRADAQPCSLYRQAADRMLANVPQQMRSRQGFSSEVLADQLKRIDYKRVENHALIEQILYQKSPLRSEEGALLLLQINNAVTIDTEQALQKQQKKHYLWSGLTFAAFISTLAVVLSS